MHIALLAPMLPSRTALPTTPRTCAPRWKAWG